MQGGLQPARGFSPASPVLAAGNAGGQQTRTTDLVAHSGRLVPDEDPIAPGIRT